MTLADAIDADGRLRHLLVQYLGAQTHGAPAAMVAAARAELDATAARLGIFVAEHGIKVCVSPYTLPDLVDDLLL